MAARRRKSRRICWGFRTSLFARDSVYKTGNSYYAFGVDPHYEKLYFEKYIKFDPLNAVYLTLAVGDVISNSNIIPHAEFVETRFYKEWAQPQGWTDNVIASLERSSTSIAGFVVFRHERDGLADDDTRVNPTNRQAEKTGTEWSRLVTAIANPDLHAIVAFCLIGFLLALNLILRFPDFGAVIEQYNQF